ncbi:MAG: hypothetical protein ACYDA6_11385 [Solirubrobacteraceae bacterium]
MPIAPNRRRHAPLALVLLGACLMASACGGSSNKPATNAAVTSATTTSLAATVSDTRSTSTQARSTANNPSAIHGSTPTSSPPATTSSHKSTSPAPRTKPAKPSTNFSPELVAALKTFASCIRSQGVNLPEPNLSGHGQVFNSAGLNTNSPQFHAALTACEGDLLAILRAGGAHIPGATAGG